MSWSFVNDMASTRCVLLNLLFGRMVNHPTTFLCRNYHHLIWGHFSHIGRKIFNNSTSGEIFLIIQIYSNQSFVKILDLITSSIQLVYCRYLVLSLVMMAVHAPSIFYIYISHVFVHLCSRFDSHCYIAYRYYGKLSKSANIIYSTFCVFSGPSHSNGDPSAGYIWGACIVKWYVVDLIATVAFSIAASNYQLVRKDSVWYF